MKWATSPAQAAVGGGGSIEKIMIVKKTNAKNVRAKEKDERKNMTTENCIYIYEGHRRNDWPESGSFSFSTGGSFRLLALPMFISCFIFSLRISIQIDMSHRGTDPADSCPSIRHGNIHLTRHCRLSSQNRKPDGNYSRFPAFNGGLAARAPSIEPRLQLLRGQEG